MAAYAIQFRRGTTTQHSSFTGLLGEVTVDTDKKTLVVHDGSTTGGFPLSREGAAATSSTGSFSSNVTVGGTLAVTSTSTFSNDVGVTGDLTMTGHILPSANITYDLGSSTHMWRDIYVGPGSLYVNNKKVIEDDSGTINISTDANQDLKFTTSGTGTLKLIGANGISITGELNATSGDLQVGDHIDMNSNLIKELATPVTGSDAANKTYVDTVAASAVTGGTNAVSGTTGAFSSDVTITGDLTVNGTTTTINTTQIDLADNILLLNSDATGSASVNAGIEVERGDDANVSIVWDETNDKWTIGSHTFVASTFEGDLTGDVTGTVSSIANHDTDDLSEGSTNKYFSNTLARGAVSAGGDLSYNSSTGAFSFTERTDAEVTTLAKAAISAGGDLSYSNGVVSFTERTDGEVRGLVSVSGDLAYNSTTGVISFTQNDAWSNITGTPTTVSGYGITDAYTKSEVDAAIQTKDALSELSGTTDDVTEGSTNKYFSNTLARGAVSAGGDLSYNSSTGAFSFTERTDGEVRGLVSASGDLSYNSTTGAFSFTERTDGEVRGLISVTDAGGDGSLAYNSATGVITYTGPNATEVRAHLSAGTGVTYSGGQFSIGQAVATTSDVTFNDLVVSGDLTVSGTTTSINTTEINLADNILLLNSDATGSATASAGIEIERGDDLNVQFLWDEANDRWSVGSEDIYTTGTITGDLVGDVTGTVSSIANHDTDDLTEGTNKFFSNALADARIALQVGANLDLSSMTTANLSEDSSNKYYTDTRVGTYLTTNSYATESYVDSAVAGKDALSELSGTTDDVTEGSTNKYFSNTLARGAVSAGGDLSYNSSTGAFSFTERTDAEVTTLAKAAISASGDLSYSNGVVSFTERTDAEVTTLAKAAISVGGDLSYSNGVVSYTTPAEVDNYVDSLSFSGGTLTVGRTGALSDLTVDITTATTMKHTHGYSVTASDETNNTGSTHAITWATLNGTDKIDFGTSAVAYGSEIEVAPFVQVFINRMVLRPNEVTISSAGLTFAADVIAQDDEVEIMYMDEK